MNLKIFRKLSICKKIALSLLFISFFANFCSGFSQFDYENINIKDIFAFDLDYLKNQDINISYSNTSTTKSILNSLKLFNCFDETIINSQKQENKQIEFINKIETNYLVSLKSNQINVTNSFNSLFSQHYSLFPPQTLQC
jgi:hypothetical protein